MARRRIHRRTVLEVLGITAAACGEKNQRGEKKCFHGPTVPRNLRARKMIVYTD